MPLLSRHHSWKLSVCIAGGVATLVVLAVIGVRQWFQPHVYYFTIPAGSDLTEPVAIELSKKALSKTLTGDTESGPGMHPVAYDYDDERHYFVVNVLNPNNGYVQWVTSQGNYIVDVEKDGDEVVCRVYRSK